MDTWSFSLTPKKSRNWLNPPGDSNHFRAIYWAKNELQMLVVYISGDKRLTTCFYLIRDLINFSRLIFLQPPLCRLRDTGWPFFQKILSGLQRKSVSNLNTLHHETQFVTKFALCWRIFSVSKFVKIPMEIRKFVLIFVKFRGLEANSGLRARCDFSWTAQKFPCTWLPRGHYPWATFQHSLLMLVYFSIKLVNQIHFL